MSVLRRMSVLVMASLAMLTLAAVPAFAAADDDFPGVPLPASPVVDTLNFHPGFPDGDEWDVYSVVLAEGDELQLSLGMQPAGAYDLELWYEEGGEIGQRPILMADLKLVDFWVWRFPQYLSYSVPEGRSGTYYVVVNNGIGEPFDGTYTLTWQKSSDKVERLWGASRLGTNSAITRSTFTTSTAVVLASGTGYADALAASGLAGALDAPIVLVTPGEWGYEWGAFPDDVTDVYLVGGTNALPAEVEDMLSEVYDVTRIAGKSRYETAALVADEVAAITGGCDSAFVVTGAGFADALAVSPIAYSQKIPVLLTESGNLTPVAATRIDTMDIEDVVIAGGTAVVSDTVLQQVDALNGGLTSCDRWAGGSRFATAATVATEAVGRGWASFDAVGVANGYGYADALSGGAFLGKRGGVLLLSGQPALSPETASLLGPSTQKATMFGGTSVLSNNVGSGLTAALAP